MNDFRGKIIAVTGARANIGKTSLARRIVSILPEAVFVKIGHGEKKPDIDNIFYHTGTEFSTIARDNRDARYLVIESNSILKEIDPDCVIYLPGENRKRSAALAEEKADLARGEMVKMGKMEELSEKLDLPEETVVKIMEAAGALPPGGE